MHSFTQADDAGRNTASELSDRAGQVGALEAMTALTRRAAHRNTRAAPDPLGAGS